MLYSKKEILQKYVNNPQKWGLTKEQLDKSFFTSVSNCDDNFNIYIEIKNNIVNIARFEGRGCAVSFGSTEALLNLIEGKDIKKVNDIINMYEDFLNNKINNINDELKVFDIVRIHTSRRKCALAPIDAIRKGIIN